MAWYATKKDKSRRIKWKYIKKNNRQEILETLFYDIPKYKKIILYSPTFRDDKSVEYFPFIDFNMDDFNSYLEDNKYLVFIRGHKFESQGNVNKCNRIRMIGQELVEDIMEIINIFDMVITDYSSIYIDYLILQRPIMFLPYDYNEYIRTRGFNFNYDLYTPGPKPSNYLEFKEEIDKLFLDKEYYSKSRNEINNVFNRFSNNNCKQ